MKHLQFQYAANRRRHTFKAIIRYTWMQVKYYVLFLLTAFAFYWGFKAFIALVFFIFES
jgi:hypothetical protein